MPDPSESGRLRALSSHARRDPEGTRAALLAAATAEFARHGYAGARIERLVKRAGTSVRMVYHYFGSKAALYIAVLEAAMRSLRQEERKLDLSDVEPLDGLLRLLDFIFDHFAAHPELISLLSAENLQRAKYLSQSAAIQQMSSPVIRLIDTLVRRGTGPGAAAADAGGRGSSAVPCWHWSPAGSRPGWLSTRRSSPCS